MSSTDQSRKSINFEKWTYVPGRLVDLKPINIEEIKKQNLEKAKEEFEEEIVKENGLFSPESVKPLVADSPISKAKNAVQYFNFKELFDDCETVLITDDKENIVVNAEPLNLSKEKKINDSFDLDFSSLALSTPVKRAEINFSSVTPRINIIPSQEDTANKRMQLITPRINSVSRSNQFVLNKPLFKTPQNKPLSLLPYSARKLPNTFQSLKISTPLAYKSIPETKELCIFPVDQNIQPDQFSRITVKGVEYIVINILGKGGSSEVYHCFNVEDKIHVAIKCVSLLNKDAATGYINEVKLLDSLQKCDRIIKMYNYEIIEEEEKLFLVLEKGYEDLSAILKQLASKQSHLPTYMVLFYWMEMLYAVQQIHMNGVIHSDLKPGNFLRVEGGLKLIDFGIASKVQEDMTCVYKSFQEGSVNYISPEALLSQNNKNMDSPSFGTAKYRVHYKSDVWSLGCILYQLVYRVTPFQHINPIWAKVLAITNPSHVIEYPAANWVSPRIIKTIKLCLQHNVKSRPSVNELIDEYEDMFMNL